MDTVPAWTEKCRAVTVNVKESEMTFPLSGFGFLLAYVVLVGTAFFLEKFSVKQLNPYQVTFLMAIGMLITATPALWLKQGNLIVPTKTTVILIARLLLGLIFVFFLAMFILRFRSLRSISPQLQLSAADELLNVWIF